MSNCIESTYAKDRDGYAQYYDPITKKRIIHHRFVYCDFHSLPLSSIKGLCVCHKCDNPSCINPLHLFLGTNKDNVDDKVNKGRQPCVLTEADVLAIRGSSLNGGQLSRKYNVNDSTIYAILKRESWKHI